MSGISPQCPNCGHRIPMAKAMFGRGKPFACQKCEKLITIPRSGTVAAIALFIIFSIFGKDILKSPLGIPITIALIATLMFAEYLLIDPKLYTTDKKKN